MMTQYAVNNKNKLVLFKLLKADARTNWRGLVILLNTYLEYPNSLNKYFISSLSTAYKLIECFK